MKRGITEPVEIKLRIKTTTVQACRGGNPLKFPLKPAIITAVETNHKDGTCPSKIVAVRIVSGFRIFRPTAQVFDVREDRYDKYAT